MCFLRCRGYGFNTVYTQRPTYPATTNCPGTKQLTPQPSDAAPETNSDRHTPTPQPTTTAKRTTNLTTRLLRHPNRCEFATWCAASQALTRFNYQPPAPIAHDMRPSRLRKHTTCDAASVHYQRLSTRTPAQTLFAPSSSLRPNPAFDLQGTQPTKTTPCP
jgi:hypothetical protein